MKGWRNITKDEFYKRGGFANTKLCRVTRDGDWAYYEEMC